MKTLISSILLVGIFGVSGVSANEFIVTSAKAGGSQALAFDFLNDGEATALQLRLNVGEGAKVDLSKCVAALPASHSGQCGYRNGLVTVLVYSDMNALLPAGVVSIGSVTVSSAKGELSLKEALAFDVTGSELRASATQDMPGRSDLSK